MNKSIALTLAMTLASMVPASHATAAGAELLLDEHYSADGYHVDHYITRDADGILSEATLTNPTTGDAVDVWTDDETLWWDGTVAGEHMNGSMPAADFEADPQAAPICFTPVTAVLCLVGIAVLAGTGNCATLKGPCPVTESEYPDGGAPPPDSGGDGDGDSDSGESGGDEN